MHSFLLFIDSEINSQLACAATCLLEQPIEIVILNFVLIALIAISFIGLFIFKQKLSLKQNALLKSTALTSFLILLIVLTLTGYGTGLFHYWHEFALVLIVFLFIFSFLFSGSIMAFGLKKVDSENVAQLNLILGKLAGKNKIKKPRLIVFNDSNARAFVVSGFSKIIFVSTGLLEKLNKNEIEIVLLHELLHLKSGFFTVKRILNAIKLSFLGLLPLNLDELDILEEDLLDKELGAQIEKVKKKLFGK